MLDLKCHPITNYVIECSSKSSLWIQFLCTANLATISTNDTITPSLWFDKQTFSLVDQSERARHDILEELVGFCGFLLLLPSDGQLHHLHL